MFKIQAFRKTFPHYRLAPHIRDSQSGINKPAACASVEKLDELISAHVKERIEIHSSEGELLKRSLLGLLNLDIRSVRLHKHPNSNT
jgi:hypothetical protein